MELETVATDLGLALLAVGARNADSFAQSCSFGAFVGAAEDFMESRRVRSLHGFGSDGNGSERMRVRDCVILSHGRRKMVGECVILSHSRWKMVGEHVFMLYSLREQKGLERPSCKERPASPLHIAPLQAASRQGSYASSRAIDSTT